MVAIEMPAGGEQFGWDATHRREPVNPGVFDLVAIARLPDGTSEVDKGDVAVIR